MEAPQDRLSPRGVIVAVGGGAMLVALAVVVSLAFGGDNPSSAQAKLAPTTSLVASTAATTPAETTPARTTPATSATTPATTPAPTTPGPTSPPSTASAAAAPVDPSVSPAAARALARETLALVESCFNTTSDYTQCSEAAQLGSAAPAIAADPPQPGYVAITATPRSYLVRTADADGRLWGIHRRDGSLQLRRTCHEADGVTPCATPTW